MSTSSPGVIVTSPQHQWLGSSLEQQQPAVLAVLVGKKVVGQTSGPLPDEDIVSQIRRESREQDIVVLFFENSNDGWRDVPVEKLGVTPYQVSGILTSNFFNMVRGCKDNNEQAEYLKTIGLAIDEQFVGC